jgi:putative ABC transport system permease protein
MNFLRQIAVITAMNIAALPRRIGVSSVVVVGIGGVVGVLISVLALTTGVQHVVDGNARPDRIVVLTQDAPSPTASNLSRADMLTIMDLPGIPKDADGKPMATPMTLIPIEQRMVNGKRTQVPIVGIGQGYFGIHPEMRIVEGRMFEPAVRELIIGKSARGRYPNAEIGGRISDRNGEWTIVGVYESNGDTIESYYAGDIDTLMSAYRRNTIQSVKILLPTDAVYKEFQDAVAANPTLKVGVQRETELLGNLSKNINRLLSTVAYGVGAIMAVGAIFGALNTMYSAVGSRTLEIATLRAIGFGGTPVVISILVESLVLALAGAAVGAGLAWLFFDGNSISSTFGTGTQIQTAMIVSSDLIAVGIIWALVIGLIGGLFPAIRAARLPVALALQVR